MQDQTASIKNRVYAAHQKFRNPHSDAISALNAMLAFEAESEHVLDQFCKQNYLHATHLREMSALRAQLVSLLSMVGIGISLQASFQDVVGAVAKGKEGLPGYLKPPSKGRCKALRCCIAAGWADHIAKRIHSTLHMENLASQVCSYMIVWLQWRPQVPRDQRYSFFEIDLIYAGQGL